MALDQTCDRERSRARCFQGCAAHRGRYEKGGSGRHADERTLEIRKADDLIVILAYVEMTSEPAASPGPGRRIGSASGSCQSESCAGSKRKPRFSSAAASRNILPPRVRERSRLSSPPLKLCLIVLRRNGGQSALRRIAGGPCGCGTNPSSASLLMYKRTQDSRTVPARYR